MLFHLWELHKPLCLTLHVNDLNDSVKAATATTNGPRIKGLEVGDRFMIFLNRVERAIGFYVKPFLSLKNNGKQRSAAIRVAPSGTIVRDPGQS